MIILVTGATAGFGESMTRRFVENGHKVIATGRREERLQTLKDELGDGIYTAQLDVRNRAAIEEMMAGLPAQWQAIDVLVNNAGLALGLEPAHRASVEDWEDMIDTNNKGLVYMTRAVLPGMVERNRGHIINIGSTAATGPMRAVTSTGRPKPSCVSLASTCAPTCTARRFASPTSSQVWWAAPSFPTSALKATTRKPAKPTKIPRR